MKQQAKFEIHLEPGGKGFVELNGDRLPMVRDVYVDGPINDMPTVHITFYADEVDVTGEMEATDAPRAVEIKVSPDFREIERMVRRAMTSKGLI